MLGSGERRNSRLISCGNYVRSIPTHVITIRQRYRQTDGQTDRRRRLAMAIPRSVVKCETSRASNELMMWALPVITSHNYQKVRNKWISVPLEIVQPAVVADLDV